MMEWISVEDRLPFSKGFYGVSNKIKNDPTDFRIFYDGVAFLCPQDIGDVFAYRIPKYWITLEWGKDGMDKCRR